MTQTHSETRGFDESGGSDAPRKLEATFLTRRPDLGKAWIVDLGGLSTAEKLFMRTFQGAVNRTIR